MRNMLIYLLAWLFANTVLYVFAMWKDAGALEYAAIFCFYDHVGPMEGMAAVLRKNNI